MKNTLELFAHNQKAYESAIALMEKEGRAAVIHPTGTGKSFIAFKLAEDHPDSIILWLSPSEYIFRTQVENLKKTTEGLIFPNIRFLTYSKLMIDKGFMKETPQYIILDEFHRCGAAEWEKSVQKLLSSYPDAKVLGLSATSVRYLDGQRDMAQELFHGCIASEMSLGEAIVRRILPTPTYVISLYSYTELKWNRGKASGEKNEKLLEELRRTLENAEGLNKIFQKHMKNPDGSIYRGRYIVFCSGREHMEEMMERSKE